jgi:tetratricopeptide (TPR) repeat protein
MGDSDLHHEAIELLHQGAQEAIEDFKQVGDTVQEWAETLSPEQKKHLSNDFKKATILFSSEDFPPHLESDGQTLQEILEISGETFSSLYHAAYSFYQKGENKKARGLFRFLTVLDPTDTDSWIGLGITLLVDGRLEESRAAFEIARTEDPENPETYFFIAKCLLMQGQLDQAFQVSKESERLALNKVNAPCFNAAVNLTRTITNIRHKKA